MAKKQIPVFEYQQIIAVEWVDEDGELRINNIVAPNVDAALVTFRKVFDEGRAGITTIKEHPENIGISVLV